MFVVEALAIPLYCCIVLDASSILTAIQNIYIYIYIYTFHISKLISFNSTMCLYTYIILNVIDYFFKGL
jgi:hypothetical protein